MLAAVSNARRGVIPAVCLTRTSPTRDPTLRCRFNMLRGWDYFLFAACAAFAAAPTGPLSVLFVAAALLFIYKGRPRLHVYPLLWLLPFAVWGVISRGLLHQHVFGVSAHVVAAAVAVLGAAASCALEVIVPSDAHLPAPTGPFAPVGASVFLEHEEVDLMVRVYYPALPSGVMEHALPRAPFVYNGTNAAAGFAALMKSPTMMFSWVSYLQSLFWSVDFSASAPEAALAGLGPSGAAGGGTADATSLAPLPVVVFSHGLGGLPEIYSAITADLVSHGWIVVAPEHFDSSAAFAALPSGQSQPYVPLRKEQINDFPVAHKIRNAQLQQRTREVQAALDLVSWLAGDSPARRAVPIISRSDEGSRLDVAGDRLTTAPAATNDKATSATASDAAERDDTKPAFKLNTSVLAIASVLEGRVDAARVAVMGHSFGAATALSTADKDKRPKAVVALDPWMFPLSVATMQRGLHHVPSLGICGDYFTAWQANAEALRLLLSAQHRERFLAGDDADFLSAVEHWEKPHAGDGGSGARRRHKSGGSVVPHQHSNGVDPATGTIHGILRLTPRSVPHSANVLLTLKGSEHQNFNDFAVIGGRVIRWLKSAGAIEPALGIRAVRAITRAFLAEHVLRHPKPQARGHSIDAARVTGPAQRDAPMRLVRAGPDANVADLFCAAAWQPAPGGAADVHNSK